MEINNAFSSAYRGIDSGMRAVTQNASEIARSGVTTDAGKTTGNDSVRAMVEMNANAQQVEASAKTLQAADENIGTLLDVTA